LIDPPLLDERELDEHDVVLRASPVVTERDIYMITQSYTVNTVFFVS